MWMAYKKYELDKGQKTRDDYNHVKISLKEICEIDNGNRLGMLKLSVVGPAGAVVTDDAFWKRVRAKLTENQWKWVAFYIIEGMSAGNRPAREFFRCCGEKLGAGGKEEVEV